MNEKEDFDGFITRDGEMISIKDTERVLAIFLQTTAVNNAAAILWHLAEKCGEAGYFDACCKYLEKMVALVDAPAQKAQCFLRMGQALEGSGDYEAAQAAYSRAFELPQETNAVWYFLNNNRGYCLNQTGRYMEAERYCRAAIEIQPERHNAYKNLGVALEHLGQYAEAAQSYIRATKLCPTDPRALSHLDDLFAAHKEIVQEIPHFPECLHECHELVQSSMSQ